MLTDAQGNPLGHTPSIQGAPLLDKDGRNVIEAPKVAVVVPARAQVDTGFAFDLANMLAFSAHSEPGLGLRLQFEQGALIPQQRTMLARAALAGGATHLLWIDSDMRFPKWTLLHLLAQMHLHSLDVLAANYTNRSMPILPMAYKSFETLERAYSGPDAPELEQVDAVGMGLMMTKASVFTSMEEPWFQIGWAPSAQGYEGEDIYFARRLRACKVPIWLDHGLSSYIRHVGQFEFKHDHALDQREILKAEAAKAGSEEVPAAPSE